MHQITLTEYADIKQEIKNNLQNIVVSFVEIGYYLKQIRDEKMYLEDGYKDIWDFAAGEYKLDRTAASRFMSINDKYSIDGNSRYLQEQYKGFGKSTLTEMLTLPVADHELITPDTKVEDIRELKRAEKEQEEAENTQIEGQGSIEDLMPDIVPESEKPKKEEITISDVLRELFKPREMKEYLDTLVNMDPESSEMDWWVDDFNRTGNRSYKKVPFFIFFYSRTEGVKIKNLKTGTIESKTYKDFYCLVRDAFIQETVRGTDVWNQAFGAEYEAELQRQREEEQQQQEEEKRKKEIQKQREERQRQVKENQEKSAKSEEKKPEKEIMEQPEEENSAVFNKINENPDSDNNLNCDVPPCEREGEETEKAEIVTGEVVGNPEMPFEKEKNPVCDIAQNVESIKHEVELCDTGQPLDGFSITLPAAIGQRLFKVQEPFEDKKAYIQFIYPYLYEIRSEKNIRMYYRDESGKSNDINLKSMDALRIYTDKGKAEKEKARLNGEEE